MKSRCVLKDVFLSEVGSDRSAGGANMGNRPVVLYVWRKPEHSNKPGQIGNKHRSSIFSSDVV